MNTNETKQASDHYGTVCSGCGHVFPNHSDALHHAPCHFPAKQDEKDEN